MKAPFPYFGGKRDIAVDVWRAFGDVKQYIEPFCGSCAMLVQAGVCRDEEHARVHLAAMLLSPDTGKVGSLAGRLQAEFARLVDGKWLT